MKVSIIAALLLALVAVTAFADDTNPKQYPILSPYRLSAAVRTEYAWWTGKDALQLPSATTKEWGIGAAAAYSMVPKLSATGRVVYFVDSRITQYAVGLNLVIFSGPELAAKQGH